MVYTRNNPGTLPDLHKEIVMFFGNLVLAVALAIGTLIAFVLPFGVLITRALGWEIGTLDGSFSNAFLSVRLGLYEMLMIGIVLFIVRKEQGLADLKKSDPLPLALYLVLPLVAPLAVKQGEVPMEFVGLALVCLLVMGYYQALSVYQRTRMPGKLPWYTRIWNRRTFEVTWIPVALCLGGILYFLHGSTWPVLYGIVWAFTGLFAIVVLLLYLWAIVINEADKARDECNMQ